MKWTGRAALLLAVAVLLWSTRLFTRWPQVYYMTGPSMEPAVRAEEYFVARGPVASLRRGTLVVFRYEDGEGVFHVLRRLVGLPGDTVAMREGRVLVNGRDPGWPFRMVAPRARRSEMARGGDLLSWEPVVVPRDSVFLLADTRDMLGWPDSRFLGPVPVRQVEAEATVLLWPRPLTRPR